VTLAPNADLSTGPVVLFDGVCNLCNVTVDALLRWDAQGRLRFASLQSERGRELLRLHGFDDDTAQASLVLIEGGHAHLRSAAVLRLSPYLRWPWSLLWLLRFVPRGLRDGLYDLVARNRYRWLGRRATCRRPGLGERDRFLE